MSSSMLFQPGADDPVEIIVKDSFWSMNNFWHWVLSVFWSDSTESRQPHTGEIDPYHIEQVINEQPEGSSHDKVRNQKKAAIAVATILVIGAVLRRLFRQRH